MRSYITNTVFVLLALMALSSCGTEPQLSAYVAPTADVSCTDMSGQPTCVRRANDNVWTCTCN